MFNREFDSHQKSKINIHILIRGRLNHYCLELNKQINQITSSEILFSSLSLQVPHITLFMGYIHNLSDLAGVMEKLGKFSREYNKFELDFSKPYLKEPEHQYMFLDVSPANFLIDIKKRIELEFSDYLSHLDWDVANEPPHLTIGYSADPNKYKLSELFDKYPNPPKMVVDAFNVSVCGKKGTCIGALKSFELGA